MDHSFLTLTPTVDKTFKVKFSLHEDKLYCVPNLKQNWFISLLIEQEAVIIREVFFPWKIFGWNHNFCFIKSYWRKQLMIQSPDLEDGHTSLPESVLLVKTHSHIAKFKFCKMQNSIPACKDICSSLSSPSMVLLKYWEWNCLDLKSCTAHKLTRWSQQHSDSTHGRKQLQDTLLQRVRSLKHAATMRHHAL